MASGNDPWGTGVQCQAPCQHFRRTKCPFVKRMGLLHDSGTWFDGSVGRVPNTVFWDTVFMERTSKTTRPPDRIQRTPPNSQEFQ